MLCFSHWSINIWLIIHSLKFNQHTEPTISSKLQKTHVLIFISLLGEKKSHAWCQICIQWQFSGAEMQSRGSWIKQGPNSDKRPNLRGLKWKQKCLKGDETRFVTGSVKSTIKSLTLTSVVLFHLKCGRLLSSRRV